MTMPASLRAAFRTLAFRRRLRFPLLLPYVLFQAAPTQPDAFRASLGRNRCADHAQKAIPS
jgi:hypothetical protein